MNKTLKVFLATLALLPAVSICLLLLFLGPDGVRLEYFLLRIGLLIFGFGLGSLFVCGLKTLSEIYE